MHVRRLLFAQLGVLVLLYISHQIGIHYFNDSAYNSFFAITHLLGGVWAALLVLWARALMHDEAGVLLCVLGALGVGIAWEFFEIVADLTSISSPYYAGDTTLDIVMDTFGGFVGAFLAKTSSFFRRDAILAGR